MWFAADLIFLEGKKLTRQKLSGLSKAKDTLINRLGIARKTEFDLGDGLGAGESLCSAEIRHSCLASHAWSVLHGEVWRCLEVKCSC